MQDTGAVVRSRAGRGLALRTAARCLTFRNFTSRIGGLKLAVVAVLGEGRGYRRMPLTHPQPWSTGRETFTGPAAPVAASPGGSFPDPSVSLS